MKNRLLLLATAFALAFSPAIQAQPAKEPQTELGATMDKISKDWRAVKNQLSDSTKNADTLAKLASMKQNMLDSAKLEPALKKELPAAEQPKFVADYQARMKKEIEKVDQIAALVKEGKNEEASKLTGALDQAQKDAHKQFKKQKAPKKQQ